MASQFNAEGTEIVFLYRIGKCPKYYGKYFRTYVFTVAVDGSLLWRVPLTEGAFHDFGARGRLLVSDKVPRRRPPWELSSPAPGHDSALGISGWKLSLLETSHVQNLTSVLSRLPRGCAPHRTSSWQARAGYIWTTPAPSSHSCCARMAECRVQNWRSCRHRGAKGGRCRPGCAPGAQGGHRLFHVRKNATLLVPPRAVAALGMMQPTPYGGAAEVVALASQGDPQSLVLWTPSRNDSLAIGGAPPPPLPPCAPACARAIVPPDHCSAPLHAVAHPSFSSQPPSI